jgi:hypothetical protein
MWFASAKPPYGTLDAAEWAPSTASKADMCSALGNVRFVPIADMQGTSLALLQGIPVLVLGGAVGAIRDRRH